MTGKRSVKGKVGRKLGGGGVGVLGWRESNGGLLKSKGGNRGIWLM